jgi:hypothetical protein
MSLKLYVELGLKVLPAIGRRFRESGKSNGRSLEGSACRKSNSNILVVQPAQHRAAKNGPGQFDGARDRRILLQR